MQMIRLTTLASMVYRSESAPPKIDGSGFSCSKKISPNPQPCIKNTVKIQSNEPNTF